MLSVTIPHHFLCVKTHHHHHHLVQLRNPNSVNCHFPYDNNQNLTATVSHLYNKQPLRASSSLILSSSSVATESDEIGDEATSTLRDICQGHVPEHVLTRMDEVGFIVPTDIQKQALPILFTGRDCILHAQTGSGKTLTYLLLIFSLMSTQRSVQALIVVPTRELGMQVTKVARMLADKDCIVMALLDGGMLRRHKSWLKADPPAIVVATMGSLCQMLEKQVFKLDKVKVIVVDEVDYMFNSSKYVTLVRKLLTSYSSIHNRHTVFASASIPQHRRFLYESIQQKWTKSDAVHVHVSAVEPMPSFVRHKFVICSKKERQQALLSLLETDAPKSGIIFVGDQSEKSKRAGIEPSTTLLTELLKSLYGVSLDIILLEEDMNFNQRAVSLADIRQGGGYLLVSTDIAARGVDLPETTHIYNFDLPKNAVDYLHRAGRTGRKPFSDQVCSVTTIVTSEERFVLQRFENELMFDCEEIHS